jgi:hypothetical protein
MRRGTSAASFRRYQSVQLGLAATFMSTTKRNEPKPNTDNFVYEPAPAGVKYVVVDQIGLAMREKLAA